MSVTLSNYAARVVYQFLEDLCDPEGFGFAVSAEVRKEAKKIKERLDLEAKQIPGSV